MQVIKNNMKKSDRLHRIFTLLIAEQYVCSSAKEAYKYVSQIFKKIEDEFSPPRAESMHLIEFRKFKHIQKHRVYTWTSHRHVIFLHEKGSYAIYDKLRLFEMDPLKFVEKYRNPKIEPRVMVTNFSGEPVWLNE